MIPAPAISNVHGVVRDSIERPVSGARVELVDGSQAGQFVMTDSDGGFAFAPFTASVTAVTIRVTRDGYAPATVSPRRDSENTIVRLTPLTRVDPTGEYQLTLTAADVCEALPLVVRTRRYTAGITGGMVTVGGADLVPHYNVFWLTAADDAVRFYLFSAYASATWLEEAPIVERVDATSYLSFSGLAMVTPWNPSQSITALNGTIGYCAGAKEPSRPEFPPTCLVPPVECQSSSHRLSLTRR
jgi:hypothetical protein